MTILRVVACVFAMGTTSYDCGGEGGGGVGALCLTKR